MKILSIRNIRVQILEKKKYFDIKNFIIRLNLVINCYLHRLRIFFKKEIGGYNCGDSLGKENHIKKINIGN